MGDLGAVRKPGQHIPVGLSGPGLVRLRTNNLCRDKQGSCQMKVPPRGGRPLMGTLVLMGTFISAALLKATGVGKNRRKKRIWGQEKSPAARANTGDGSLGLCWGIKYRVYFQRVTTREGKEK